MELPKKFTVSFVSGKLEKRIEEMEAGIARAGRHVHRLKNPTPVIGIFGLLRIPKVSWGATFLAEAHFCDLIKLRGTLKRKLSALKEYPGGSLVRLTVEETADLLNEPSKRNGD